VVPLLSLSLARFARIKNMKYEILKNLAYLCAFISYLATERRYVSPQKKRIRWGDFTAQNSDFCTAYLRPNGAKYL
jgi:hypothetical protein